MKKGIINKVGIKLLILIPIDIIISLLFLGFLLNMLHRIIGDNIDFYEKYGAVIAIVSFVLELVIFIVIFLIAINGRIKYLNYISKSVTNIKTQHYLNPIEIKGNDEIFQLAEDINTMSERLKENYEKEKKQEEAKNELIVAVSHDLKTPLTSVIGYLELLNKDKESFTEKQQEFLKVAYEKSGNLKKLIDELFEYTKLSNNYVKLDKVPFNIAVLVNQIVGEHVLFLSEKNIKVEIECAKNELIYEIDMQKFVRVIENLVKNAEKYSYKDSTFKIIMWDDEENIKLSFINEGDNINEEDLLKIFDEMYRIDKSRNAEIEGSGLGLPISKKIIELHGGRIWAECNDNKIKFNIELPKISE
ncbi:HAMP domain-containing sensor histidine kinase [Clostridium beijerinckii]|jgi:Osmosensitive K+ channel histidine kinase|uniref:histidine kinase n=2 Tax=Clostridium beijerinckii TaxID=1520 RepID=A0AAE2V201_CLOBE|nr:HAMP domain-containing sensor histidine kinase [Clostridium beijerinckii]MBF7810968.1 HAMP domain-containing histidine kinase [Clostridium beijerinckii]NRT24268.1 signal transduction histidine kinase [Clostridium beijerinckii]NRT68143.1 signal transduction histidine kinase [Clostridium beijerinckii]NRT85823.1 signal transduction histidine kinase [Clostridium beijerinckii]NRU47721.1 signal transduction histidine kinase [Clostridium beijerinckii]